MGRYIRPCDDVLRCLYLVPGRQFEKYSFEMSALVRGNISVISRIAGCGINNLCLCFIGISPNTHLAIITGF